MTPIMSSATLLARILLSLLFIIAGYGKVQDVAGFTGYMTSGGVPALLAWPTIALELLGGLAVLFGLLTRPAALALGGFSILTALLFHLVPSDAMQMVNFWKNAGLAGGFLLLGLHGGGAYSLDAVLARRSSAVA